MSFESLLVYVEADREQTNLVNVAADVAARYGSSIVGLSALGVRPPFVAEGVVIDVGGEAEIEQMKLSLATRDLVSTRCCGRRGSVLCRPGGERRLEPRQMPDGRTTQRLKPLLNVEVGPVE